MPKPPRTPMIPSSGFDGETPNASPVPGDVPMPVPPAVALNPEPLDPAPAVSFAPPMQVEGQQPVTMAPTPMMPTTDAFAIQQEMQAMRQMMSQLIAENQQLKASNEALAETTQTALTRPAAAAYEPPAPPQPKHKLYFVGQRLEPASNGMPAHMVIDLCGGVHTCGRLPSPVTFGASQTDQRPHAFVTKGDGDWLIANDCQFNAYGLPAQKRYEWSDEALQAFREAELAAHQARMPQAV